MDNPFVTVEVRVNKNGRFYSTYPVQIWEKLEDGQVERIVEDALTHALDQAKRSRRNKRASAKWETREVAA